MTKQEASHLRLLIQSLQAAREKLNDGGQPSNYTKWIQAGNALEDYISSITKE